jgi:hypothetical protein
LTLQILVDAYCSAVLVAAKHIDIHGGVRIDDLKIAVHMINVAEVFYLSSLMFLKISIGIFFLDIATSRRQKYIIYATITISTVYSTAILGFAIFQCGIYGDIMDFIIRRLMNRCVSDAAALGMLYTHGALTIITDWTYLILPFFMLRHTLADHRERWSICTILAFASISGMAAIARLPYIKLLAVPKIEIFGKPLPPLMAADHHLLIQYPHSKHQKHRRLVRTRTRCRRHSRERCNATPTHPPLGPLHRSQTHPRLRRHVPPHHPHHHAWHPTCQPRPSLPHLCVPKGAPRHVVLEAPRTHVPGVLDRKGAASHPPLGSHTQGLGLLAPTPAAATQHRATATAGPATIATDLPRG